MRIDNNNLGTYLWQNSQKIKLKKEVDCLTVYIYKDNSLKMISDLDGVLHIKRIFNEVYRLKVEESKLEFIMNTLRSGLNLVCHHAYKPINTNNTRYYITDKITVKFDHTASDSYIEKLMSELGLRYVRSYNKKTFLLQITHSSGKNPVKTSNILAKKKKVVYAEPNLINRFMPSFIPTDVKFTEQWHLKSVPGPELVANADISASKAWDITRGSRNIIIAILDDGFDLLHPDFHGLNKIVRPRDFIDGHDRPLPGPNNYHGTPCAGVALAEANGVGVVGVAPDCGFMPIRIPFGADPDLLYDIFDYVGKYADVISCSWGPPPVYAPQHQLVFDKIKELTESGGPRGKGCVIVFAAHNYNAPIKDLENKNGVSYLAGNRVYRHNDPIWNGDASHPDVLCVSASTSLNKKAAYSNWGKEIDICAPSNNYHPLDVRKKLKGRGICTTDNFNVGDYFSPNSRYTTQFGGTSSAAPTVAGVAGLVLSANPSLTAKEVKQIILDTADKIEDFEPDIVLGNRKGHYDENGHSEWFGYGKVNAFRAVQKAIEMEYCEAEVTVENNNIAPELVIEDENANTTSASSTSSSNKKTEIVELAQEKTGTLKHKQDQQIFKVSIGSKLVVQMEGSDKTDFDLYLKKDEIPTKQSYDARAISETANEKVVFEKLTAGDYYIMVTSFQGKGEFKLKISLE